MVDHNSSSSSSYGNVSSKSNTRCLRLDPVVMHNNLSFTTFDSEQQRRDHFDQKKWAFPEWFQFVALSYFRTRVYEIHKISNIVLSFKYFEIIVLLLSMLSRQESISSLFMDTFRSFFKFLDILHGSFLS